MHKPMRDFSDSDTQQNERISNVELDNYKQGIKMTDED